MPGAPLVFMGAELAPWTEWNDAGGLPWHLLEHAHTAACAICSAELNRVSRRSGRRCGSATTSRPASSGSTPTTPMHSVYGFLRWGYAGAQAVACVANFTPVPRPGYRVGLPWPGEWHVLVDTDAGSSAAPATAAACTTVTATTDDTWQGQPASAVFDLPPLGVVWLGAARP